MGFGDGIEAAMRSGAAAQRVFAAADSDPLRELARAILDGRISLAAYETRDGETGYWIKVDPS